MKNDMEGNGSNPTSGNIPVFTCSDDENHGKPKLGKTVSGSKFETAMSRICSRSSVHSAAAFGRMPVISPIWLTAGSGFSECYTNQ
jgi:hypothetical protein